MLTTRSKFLPTWGTMMANDAASNSGKANTPAQTKPSSAENQGEAVAPTQTQSVAIEKTADGQLSKLEKTVGQKVAGAVEAVLDTLTDAEQLHHKLEPEISSEPE
jgi:hypothetical protein